LQSSNHRTPFHNITQAVRLRGSLDLAALRNSLESLTNKYRTLWEIPASSSSDILQVQDFSSFPIETRERQACTFIHREAERSPEDGEPPLRTALARLSTTDSILLLSFERSLSGAAVLASSITVELSVLYNALMASPSSASPLPFVAQLEIEDQRAPALNGASNWRQQQSENAPGALELLADRPRSSQPGMLARETRTLPEALWTSVREFSAAEGVAPFTTLFSAFAALLSRYSGQKHFFVGASWGSSAVLPLRADLAHDPSFRELLERVQREAADHGESKGFPEPPLFQVAFVLEPLARETVHFAGLTVSPYDLEARSIGRDLTLHLEEHAAGLLMTADYDAALFDPDTIQRFLGHYETLLASAISDPQGALSRLPLLTQPERRRLLSEWNRTAREYPGDIPLQQLIEAQVEKTPDAVAVAFAGGVSSKAERLTYAQLNARANQLAAHLRSLGVTRNTLVGVCLERSIDLLIAPLAILKAGGAYLPLDPEHPDDHIAPIVDNARLEILIGRAELALRLPNFKGRLVVLDWDAFEQYATANHPVAVSGSDLAYVIYTSGSTGQPKGVMIPRRALNNLLCSVRAWFQFDERDVLLALTTIAFDIAGVDLWLPLLAGARILMVERGTTMDARLLEDTIQRDGVTFLQCTPASWKLLIDFGWQGKADLQAVCTGEAMPRDLAGRLFPRVGRLWNMYGPTETTIWSTGYRFSAPDDPVLIGRPVANTQVYILDEHLAPTPIGVSGELYIGGDGLADGYLRKPELTADRFVDDPFSKISGARLYKTGDLARYRSDGNIECLGRNDDQIKLRGFRIEPEEIRVALTQHPAVRDAVAVLKTSATGDSRIVAYLISRASDPPEVTELRSFLRQRLPDYMIPASFVFLDSFPLNGNGKIDRRALPQPRTLSSEIAGSEALADSIEARLRDIFCTVLGLNTIGIDDDFFDLGGHSLTAAQLFAEINVCFNLDLPLATLFHAPTVRRLAALIRDSEVEQMSAPIVAIHPNGSRPPIYCIGAVDGELIVFRRLALELGLDQRVYGLQPFRLLATCRTVKQLATAYIDELRKTGESEPFCLLGYSFGGLVAVEMARQLQRDGFRPPIVMLVDSSYPAGCRAHESWAERISRYQFNWNQIAKSKGLAHLLERVKFGLTRLAYRASSTAGVSVPIAAGHVNTLQLLASESYRIKSYHGRVHLFRAESQTEFFGGGTDLGWSGVLSDLVIDDAPGDHINMITGSNLKILAQKVRDCLQGSPSTARAAG
jgi:amino acid adenylation domain-containing protein